MRVTRELTFDDYLRIGRRRWWVILTPALLALAAGYLLSLALPKRFVSQTMVLVEQPRVSDNYVKPVMSDELNQRLQTMQEQVLSRTELQRLINRFGLYKELAKRSSPEDLVVEMRRHVTVQTVRTESSRSGVPGFYVSFTSSDPVTAQQVCAEIANSFMAANLRLREQHVDDTADFLRTQLEASKRSLDDQDRKLAAFQQRYVGQLPGQEQMNMNMLTTLKTELEGVTQALGRAQQDKSFNSSMLAQQVADWKKQQTSSNPKTIDDQLEKLQEALVTAESRYTEDYPDVVKLKKQIDSLKARLARGSIAPQKTEDAKENLVEPEQIKQLRASLFQLDQTTREKTKQQQALEAEIRRYEAKIELSPVVEEQFKALTRDYQSALGFYTDLLNKKTQSDMASALEKTQQGEQFRIVDPPNLPGQQEFPKPRLFALGGFSVGFGLGLLIAFVLELRGGFIDTEAEIQYYLGLPTLATVPVITVHKRARNRRAVQAAGGS